YLVLLGFFMKIKKKNNMLTVMIVPHSASRIITIDVSKEFITSMFFIFKTRLLRLCLAMTLCLYSR
ncbi:MAG: hypothetical protein V1833_01570, partial [Elusimicrobiota bacterium]